jgi:hypothetical protein
VTKYTNVLTSKQSALLGFGIDAMFYGMPNYVALPNGSLPRSNQADAYLEVLKYKLSKVTLADVNRVIKRYWRTDRLVIVAVTKDGEDLKRQLTSDASSPMTYNSPKPAEITEVDKVVEKWRLHLKAEDVKVVPVDRVFQ